MRAGDAHGPERKFNVGSFDSDGSVRSMKMRALDNAGACCGRTPFQLGKPISAIVGPYQINSVSYHAISVTSNKTVQEAVHGFGQAPTNYTNRNSNGSSCFLFKMDRLALRQRNLIEVTNSPI